MARQPSVLELQETINNVSANGGGVVRVPNGTYTLNAGLNMAAGVAVIGETRDGVVFKAADSFPPGHNINFTGSSRAHIINCTIDGNRNVSAGQHGVRMTNTVGCGMVNLNIISCNSYGIGLQGDEGSSNFLIRNVNIFETGSDGIDIKNRAFTRETWGYIENVSVNAQGLHKGGQSGIDVRGRTHLRNCFVQQNGIQSSTAGIRFRAEGATGNGDAAGASYHACGIKKNGGDTNFALIIEDGTNPPSTIPPVGQGGFNKWD